MNVMLSGSRPRSRTYWSNTPLTSAGRHSSAV